MARWVAGADRTGQLPALTSYELGGLGHVHLGIKEATVRTGRQPQSPIAPAVFGAAESGYFCRYEAVGHILQETCTHLNISLWRLGKLLSLSSNLIYRWRNGSRRPSSLYLARLWYLWILRDRGAEVARWKRIDWESGAITTTDNTLILPCPSLSGNGVRPS